MKALIEILEDTKTFIFESIDSPYSPDSSFYLTAELEACIQKLENNDVSMINEIKIHFLPTGSYQEFAIENKWEEDYLSLANAFDNLYHCIIHTQPGKSSTT